MTSRAVSARADMSLTGMKLRTGQGLGKHTVNP
jgi:hypothetical protein